MARKWRQTFNFSMHDHSQGPSEPERVSRRRRGQQDAGGRLSASSRMSVQKGKMTPAV
ncbi:hypothetical protein M407DRAFT_240995 [Tulasnella calospora MUT 4182]|uniref:Uncharacterized protein n=1 Tax=Tulasnella calospora MUT 4182 TaxID=1051891 RepID=A0A0C3QLI3_9AGAM|nr:hypothetical protein M407DRAFT_240995 [Tulasnella calospora MUT 4182]